MAVDIPKAVSIKISKRFIFEIVIPKIGMPIKLIRQVIKPVNMFRWITFYKGIVDSIVWLNPLIKAAINRNETPSTLRPKRAILDSEISKKSGLTRQIMPQTIKRIPKSSVCLIL